MSSKPLRDKKTDKKLLITINSNDKNLVNVAFIKQGFIYEYLDNISVNRQELIKEIEKLKEKKK